MKAEDELKASWPLSAAPPTALGPDRPSCGAQTRRQARAGTLPGSPQKSPVSSSSRWTCHEKRWSGWLEVPELNPISHLETEKRSTCTQLWYYSSRLKWGKKSCPGWSVFFFTCFILQDEVKLIRLLKGIWGNNYLLIQHLVKFRTNWTTKQNLLHKTIFISSSSRYSKLPQPGYHLLIFVPLA